MYHTIKAAFAAHADLVKAGPMAAYMRNRFMFYGIQSAEHRQIAAPFIAEARKAGVIDWSLLQECFADPYRDLHYFALGYLRAMKQYLTFDDLPRLEYFATRQQWWDSIDTLDRIIGSIGLSDSRLDSVMVAWSQADDFWLRRIAIDHQLDRKAATNKELLAEIICNNFGSKEFFVNKAIGWSLRQYARSNEAWVREFLAKHRVQLHPLSYREASKHLH